MKKLVIRKYNGDDSYSWAIFKSEDVGNNKGIITCSHIKPIMSGLQRSEASYYKSKLEK